jgi:hypothetical protein
MKKVVLTASLLSITLGLSACGGGGSDDSPANNTVAQATLFDGSAKVYMYEFDGEDGTDKLSLTLKNDLLYLNSTRLADQYSSYFLTDKALYQPETPKTVNLSLGIRDSLVKSISANKWVLTPYSQNGATDLEMTQQFETIDLSGKAIAPVVNPVVAALSVYNRISQLDYVGVPLGARIFLNKNTFPQGAKCLRFVSTDNNKNYLEFEPEIEDTQVEGAKNLQDWANLAFNAQLTVAPTIAQSTWATYNWGSIALKDEDADGKPQSLFAIEYQGKVFNADYTSSGKQTYAQRVATFQQRETANNVDPVLLNLVVNNLQNTCSFYNQTAASAIDQAIEKAQNKSITLPIKGDLPVSGNPSDVPNCNGGLAFC